ncbi:hypothetical protein [Pseudomonas fluorescens]|uniref:Uncharacterized protein n=1 Tax=Pseudomonas fluorescens TaxID=294 RepID=A0A5E7V810_PSEFL|nr:hypothetical protein [Pseudomonas fluorescens]VVQ20172.1 hypothetical protein PS941_04938 [Pseudomonas fluorescens]
MLRRYREYWIDQAEWWCSRTLEWWAKRLTAFYFGGAIIVMGAKFDDLIILKLNEMGDLAAGVFGPLAFLWLVLGYIQQGRELRISSEALRMQADELKASVQQQTALVEAQQDSLRNYERSLEPLLVLKYQGSKEIEGEFYEQFSLINVGPYCEDVSVKLSVDGVEKYPIALEPLFREVERGFYLPDMDSNYQKYELEIFYKKISGRDNTQIFDLTMYHDEDGPGLRVKKRPMKA